MHNPKQATRRTGLVPRGCISNGGRKGRELEADVPVGLMEWRWRGSLWVPLSRCTRQRKAIISRALPCLTARNHSAHGQPHVALWANPDLEPGTSGMSQGGAAAAVVYVQSLRRLNVGSSVRDIEQGSWKGRGVMAQGSRSSSARARCAKVGRSGLAWDQLTSK